MKPLRSLAALALIASACSQAPETGTIVLQGCVEGEPGNIVVLSYQPGQQMGYYSPKFEDGTFEFQLENVEGFADLVVSVGGAEFGARINANDTVCMSFKVNEYLKDVDVTYDRGDEAAGRMWGDFYRTYLDFWSYNIRQDADPSISADESLARLDSLDAAFRSAYKAGMDRYYSKRADLAGALMKCMLLEQKAYKDDADPYDYPEYEALIARVNPNDPEAITFSMIYRWADLASRGLGEDEISSCIAFMRKYGKKLKLTAAKDMLAGKYVSYNIRKIDADQLPKYEALLDEISKFVPENTKLIERGRAMIDAAVNSRPGALVPDTSLLTPDGKTVALSSLFGRVLYIDIWATWCGPCVREAPYFAALAGKYKGNDKIAFISISTDSTDGPWLEFLAEEKPFWPQYRLDRQAHREFCGKVGINTIPRFLLIAPDGTFIDADCIRPSDEAIDDKLNSALR